MRLYLSATTTPKKKLVSFNLISLPRTREQAKKSNDSTGRKGRKFFCSSNLHIEEKNTYNTWVPHHPICRFRDKFFVMHQIRCNLYCRRKLQRLQSLWTGTEVELSLRTVAFRKTNLSRNEPKEIATFRSGVVIVKTLLLSLCRALWRILQAKMKNFAG